MQKWVEDEKFGIFLEYKFLSFKDLLFLIIVLVSSIIVSIFPSLQAYKKSINEGPRDFIHHSEAKFLKVWKSHANKAQKLLKNAISSFKDNHNALSELSYLLLFHPNFLYSLFTSFSKKFDS